MICDKKGTIKCSNKTDKFCQIAELCEFEIKKNGFSRQWEIELLCLFAIQDEVIGEKSSHLRGNYSRQKRLPEYDMLTSFVLS